MAKQKVTDLVEALVAQSVSGTSLELVEVEYKKEGANWILRVFLDKNDGYVDLDDCAKVSEALSLQLDELDPIQNAYFLEVSSAGAERALKKARDYVRAVGKLIHVSFYEPFEGYKEIEGELLGYEDAILRIQLDDAMLAVPEDKIAGARLAIRW